MNVLYSVNVYKIVWILNIIMRKYNFLKLNSVCHFGHPFATSHCPLPSLSGRTSKVVKFLVVAIVFRYIMEDPTATGIVAVHLCDDFSGDVFSDRYYRLL